MLNSTALLFFLPIHLALLPTMSGYGLQHLCLISFNTCVLSRAFTMGFPLSSLLPGYKSVALAHPSSTIISKHHTIPDLPLCLPP
jgi:hypothetical protein